MKKLLFILISLLWILSCKAQDICTYSESYVGNLNSIISIKTDSNNLLLNNLLLKDVQIQGYQTQLSTQDYKIDSLLLKYDQLSFKYDSVLAIELENCPSDMDTFIVFADTAYKRRKCFISQCL